MSAFWVCERVPAQAILYKLLHPPLALVRDAKVGRREETKAAFATAYLKDVGLRARVIRASAAKAGVP